MSASLETPSGKGRNDENFPVGSFLIRPDLRRHVHAFYTFAREGDDIADNPDLAPDDKVARLARMGAVVQGAPGDDAPSAVRMRASLLETRLTPQHCLDLLRAFTLDATKLRYVDWDDLIDYCRYSAMPVGRHVLDLHGESRATWTSNDALCAALQVLNHLQDFVKDHQALDRVYLPEPMLAANGASIADFKQPRLTPGLRKTIDQLLDRTDALIETAAGLPPGVQDWRLRAETATIVALARRLSGRLRRGDPVAGRVKLLKVDFASSLGVGLWHSFAGPRPRAVTAP
jgi:farnesyl-diphosphate farnesyltransferase